MMTSRLQTRSSILNWTASSDGFGLGIPGGDGPAAGPSTPGSPVGLRPDGSGRLPLAVGGGVPY